MSTTSHEGLDSTVMLGLSIVGSHPVGHISNGDEVNTPEILESIVSMSPGANYNDYYQRLSRAQTFTFPTAYTSTEYPTIITNEFESQSTASRTRSFNTKSATSHDQSMGFLAGNTMSSFPSTDDQSDEEHQRKIRRRERNKVAATKCRNKKKMRNVQLVKEIEHLEFRNQRLRSEIHRLEDEKVKLRQLLEETSTPAPVSSKRVGAPTGLPHIHTLHQRTVQPNQKNMPETTRSFFEDLKEAQGTPLSSMISMNPESRRESYSSGLFVPQGS